MPEIGMSSASAALRLRTGVPGLDQLLGGGLIAGGLYLLEGVPGAGKTILASQIGFEFARQGRQAVFVTLIAESHGKLLRHVSAFDFYDERVIAGGISFLSGFSALLDGGHEALLKFLAESLHSHSCGLLILDGLAAVRNLSDSTPALARFIHQLNTLVSSTGCTALLLAPLAGSDAHPEHTLVDGLIELKRVERGLRRAREIEVHKMRGGAHLTGQHLFEITTAGVGIYPRLESLPVAVPRVPPVPPPRVPTGIPGFDGVLGGGLIAGSATSLLGSPGVGKTLLGLSILAHHARSGGSSLYFGFYEPPPQLVAKGRRIGIDVQPLLDSGRLLLEWAPSLELYIDRAALELLHMVRDRGVDLVFIDGAEGLAQASFYPERISRFLTAFTAHLRAAGVTSLLSEELPLFTPAVKSASLSAMVENALLLRFFEHDSKLRRFLSVIKLRDSDFDPSIREFTIGEAGIALREPVAGIGHVLAASPHSLGARDKPFQSDQG
jgi:circadian clock protein KaiC